jgi:hypothetical protein
MQLISYKNMIMREHSWRPIARQSILTQLAFLYEPHIQAVDRASNMVLVLWLPWEL